MEMLQIAVLKLKEFLTMCLDKISCRKSKWANLFQVIANKHSIKFVKI